MLDMWGYIGLGITLLAGSCHAGVSSYFSPGAVIEKLTNIALIDKYIHVTVNISSLEGVVDQLDNMKNVLANIDIQLQSNLKKFKLFQFPVLENAVENAHIQEMTEETFLNLLQTVVRVNDKLVSARKWFPARNVHGRDKKAAVALPLLGLLGVVNTAFNFVKEAELRELKRVTGEHSIILTNIKLNDVKQTLKINEVILGLNRTSQLVSHLDFTQHLYVSLHLLNINVILNNIEAELDFVVHEAKKTIDMLTEAAAGHITPDILTFKQLTEILHNASTSLNFKPIFDLDSLHYYYKIMDISISYDALIISVPMGLLDSFYTHQIHPFPTVIDGNTVVLKTDFDLLLLSEDHSYTVESHSSILSSCRNAPKLRVCMGGDFILKNFEAQSPCTRRLISGSPNASYCSFDHYEAQEEVLQTIDATYLFLKEETTVAINCDGEEAFTVHFRGNYQVEPHCDIVSKFWSLRGDVSFNEFMTSSLHHRKAVFWVKEHFVNLTIPVLPNIEGLGKQNSFSIFHPHANNYIPWVSVLIAVFITIFVLGCWLLRHKMCD